MNDLQVKALLRVVADAELSQVNGEFIAGKRQDESLYSSTSRYPLMNLVRVVLNPDYMLELQNADCEIRCVVQDTLDSSMLQRELLIHKAYVALDRVMRRLALSVVEYSDGTRNVLTMADRPNIQEIIRENSAITSGWRATFRLGFILNCFADDFDEGDLVDGPFLLLEDGGRVLLEYLPV